MTWDLSIPIFHNKIKALVMSVSPIIIVSISYFLLIIPFNFSHLSNTIISDKVILLFVTQKVNKNQNIFSFNFSVFAISVLSANILLIAFASFSSSFSSDSISRQSFARRTTNRNLLLIVKSKLSTDLSISVIVQWNCCLMLTRNWLTIKIKVCRNFVLP